MCRDHSIFTDTPVVLKSEYMFVGDDIKDIFQLYNQPAT
jgi:hypothetical protein